MTRERALIVAHKQRVAYVPERAGGPHDGTWWWFCHERVADRIGAHGHLKPCSMVPIELAHRGGFHTVERAFSGALDHRRAVHRPRLWDGWFHAGSGYWGRR